MSPVRTGATVAVLKAVGSRAHRLGITVTIHDNVATLTPSVRPGDDRDAAVAAAMATLRQRIVMTDLPFAAPAFDVSEGLRGSSNG